MHATQWENECKKRKEDPERQHATTCADCEQPFPAYELSYELNDNGLCFACHYNALEEGHLEDIYATRDEYPELHEYVGKQFVRIEGERHCTKCYSHVNEDATKCVNRHNVGCTKCFSTAEKFCANCGKNQRSTNENKDDEDNYYNDEYKMSMDYYYEVMGYND